MRSVLVRLALALLLASCAAFVACKSDGQKRGSSAADRVAGGAVTIDTGTRKLAFHVELALTSEEHERGLMYRDHLAPDAGMLFVFPEARTQTFWMKNTLIPLDMIFIGRDRRIVGIVENAEPRTLDPRRVEGASQYVLEIGGGLSGRLGIRAGQSVDLPPAASL